MRNASALACVCALAIGFACHIDTRSQSYRCDGPADCDDGRSCVGGWCVDPSGDDDGGAIDAVASDAGPDAFVCPAVCDACTGGACIIHCDSAGACPDKIVCPPGMPCTIDCGHDTACSGGVDCADATSCAITCTGAAACAGAITCGAGACDVQCTGTNSCPASVTCGDSCRCDVGCNGAGSCTGTNLCAPHLECDTGAGCTSAPNRCHSC